MAGAPRREARRVTTGPLAPSLGDQGVNHVIVVGHVPPSEATCRRARPATCGYHVAERLAWSPSASFAATDDDDDEDDDPAVCCCCCGCHCRCAPKRKEGGGGGVVVVVVVVMVMVVVMMMMMMMRMMTTTKMMTLLSAAAVVAATAFALPHCLRPPARRPRSHARHDPRSRSSARRPRARKLDARRAP